MSLTSLLKASRGPVWDWFAVHFPETQRVCTKANRELRGGPAKEPCAVPPFHGTDHALVGTAVGYLLSAHLRPDALNVTVATHGAARLDGSLRRIKVPPSGVERLVVAHIVELRPWERELDRDGWATLSRLVCILARFEQYFRAGPAALPHLTGQLKQHGDDLAALASAFATPPTLADVDTLGRATVADWGHIRDAKTLYMGPTFAQSARLGGADADIIYDGTLIDLKSSAQPGVVQRHEAWQLLGYLLADTHDAYGIRELGFAALRRRRSLTWAAQDFVDTLAGNSCPPLQHWRVEFVRLVQTLPSRDRRSRAE